MYDAGIMDKLTGPAEPEQFGHRRWIFADYVKKGVQATLVLSLLIFAVYIIGSMPDPGFSDHFLFLLLRMLRYTSLLLCAFSFSALGFGVHRLVHFPKLRNILILFCYFAVGLLGAIFSMLDSLVVAAAGGNV